MSASYPIEVREGCEFGHYNIPFGIFSPTSENSKGVSWVPSVLELERGDLLVEALDDDIDAPYSLIGERAPRSGTMSSTSASLHVTGYSTISI